MVKKTIDFDTIVTQIMSSPVKPINENITLGEAIKFFLDNKFSGTLVVDDKGRDVGVLSFKDVAQYTEQLIGEVADQISQVKVSDIMTRNVVAIEDSSTVMDAIDVLIDRHFHRVFVKNTMGKVTGIISTLDLINWLKGISRS